MPPIDRTVSVTGLTDEQKETSEILLTQELEIRERKLYLPDRKGDPFEGSAVRIAQQG
ncbi:hypothetical protein HOF92_13880 [bacterium]|jgi:hypothetical protein|nr:hypothetical protein [bacterium]